MNKKNIFVSLSILLFIIIFRLLFINVRDTNNKIASIIPNVIPISNSSQTYNKLYSMYNINPEYYNLVLGKIQNQQQVLL